ncbi:hypothetical protein BUALT_Bualt09G0022800 [Buddleja alternifolia]|uniref:RING-type E3 ubiquitin transferase n=1 Tax=Buddleja alternifolia TaxID=168488 RepID=A0AAV6XA08_9LAMI|nr:hypothetical protein BUALT_Bualt09G0022800 [Buddleja alternifolia]
MNQFMGIVSLFLLLNFIYFFTNVKAQTLGENTEGIPSQESMGNFQPSLAVVIGMLSIMFSLTFILLLYAKFCHRATSSVHNNMGRQIQDGLIRSRSCVSGIDKTVIESLPFFRFSSLKGSRDGLECAVCLSKFEDIEILRLLPKCKHAFHIDCIDQWLEKHSTCPLCRQKVSLEDLSQLSYSSSLRFLWNSQSELREDSNLELYVEREENHHGSSRFSIGSSFRISENKGKKEEELPIQQHMIDFDDEKDDYHNKPLHKFNHKILVSDIVLQNRWSNVSSSDLMFLNSEMLNDVSSARFSSSDSRNYERSMESSDYMVMNNIKEEIDRKRVFESKIKEIPFSNFPTTSDSGQNHGFESKALNQNEKRSMSEIIVHPRFRNKEDSSDVTVKEKKLRGLWLPIARKTVEWYANRERRPNQLQLNVSYNTYIPSN